MTKVTRRLVFSGSVLSFGLVGLGAHAQSGVWVVTSQEAALPQSASSKAGRAISRGPAIRQVSPAAPVAANQPFALQVEFAARGGEKINPASAQVTILRGNTVNVTQRLQPYLTANGIVIPNAMVPAGTHVLQVAVSDSGGRQSLANIEIEAR